MLGVAAPPPRFRERSHGLRRPASIANSYALSDTAEGAYYFRIVASEWRTLAFIRTFTVHHTFAGGVQKLKDPDHLLHRLLTERAFSFCISSEPGFTVQIGVPLSP